MGLTDCADILIGSDTLREFLVVKSSGNFAAFQEFVLNLRESLIEFLKSSNICYINSNETKKNKITNQLRI